MQDLASEFSNKFSGGYTPSAHNRRGRLPPVPNTQGGLWPGVGRKRPGVGTQTMVPLDFSAVVAPLKSWHLWTAPEQHTRNKGARMQCCRRETFH